MTVNIWTLEICTMLMSCLKWETSSYLNPCAVLTIVFIMCCMKGNAII